MERLEIEPRIDWENTVESQGLLWHSSGNENDSYWTENAVYKFSTKEIDELEKATYDLNEKCLEAVQYIIDKGDEVFDSFEMYDWMRNSIRNSWKEEEFTLFGRFDFSYDGKSPPKLLEYNADTPTGLIESSIIQWHWLQDMKDELHGDKIDQFNSTHEKLIEAWQVLRRKYNNNDVMNFTSLASNIAVEDYITCNYLRDTCIQAGWTTNYFPIDELGWNSEKKEFRDQNENPIKLLTKLYPWEFLAEEEIGDILSKNADKLPRVIEAPWKSLLSNKALLVLLYEMFPDCPYLLKASYEAEDMGKTYVKKPQFSREGANITIVKDGNTIEETIGEYGNTKLWIYQDFHPLPNFNGNRPVIGSWLINGHATGIGIRESDDLITGNLSRFVPHYFTNKKPGFLSRINPFG